MRLTKFINIFVSRLPPRPSVEIALTKPYRLHVEADDLLLFFFFLRRETVSTESSPVLCRPPPRVGTRAHNLLLGSAAESEFWNFVECPWVGAGALQQLQEPQSECIDFPLIEFRS